MHLTSIKNRLLIKRLEKIHDAEYLYGLVDGVSALEQLRAPVAAISSKQWGRHGERGAQAYTGGLGAEPLD